MCASLHHCGITAHSPQATASSSPPTTRTEQIGNLVGTLDSFVDAGGFRLNVNVLDRANLLDAMEHPDAYPSLTIRVSGYAVNFVRLTCEQQLDVVNRTFHAGV